MQIGETETISDPAVEWGPARDKATLINTLQKAGFKSMHTYDDDDKSHFGAPWAFLTCFKDSKSRARWYRSVPELEIDIHQRLFRTKSGKPTLRYFDAPTMIGYQTPTKAQETVFCRSRDIDECDDLIGFDTEGVVIPPDHVEARKSNVGGEFGGRGLFAVHDIPKYSTLSLNMSVKALHVLPLTWSVFRQLHDWAGENRDEMESTEDELSAFHTFTEGMFFSLVRYIVKTVYRS